MRRSRSRGYTLVAMMIGITVMMIMIAAILPTASTQMQREREDELIFRGRQYAEAIRCFRRRYGRYPTSLKEMLDARPRTLRKLWKDPITNSAEWGLVSALVGAPVPGQPTPSIRGGTGKSGSTFGGSGTFGGFSSFGSSGGFGSTFGSGGKFGSGGTSGSRGARPTPVPTPDTGGSGERQPGVPDTSDPFAPPKQNALGPVAGVYSLSSKKALRMYLGRDVYRDWQFTEQSLQVTGQAPDLGGPIVGGPGGPGGGRGPVGPPGGGAVPPK